MTTSYVMGWDDSKSVIPWPYLRHLAATGRDDRAIELLVRDGAKTAMGILAYRERIGRDAKRTPMQRLQEAIGFCRAIYPTLKLGDRSDAELFAMNYIFRRELTNHIPAVLDLWRRGRRVHSTVPLEECTEVANTCGELGRAEMRLILKEAIMSLPPDLSISFLLIEVEEMTYDEAASALDVPVGTVKSRVHLAKVRLRTLLNEEGPGKKPAKTNSAGAL